MRTATILGIVGLLLAAALAAAWYVWKRPLAVYAWSSRRALASAGLVKQSIESPSGPQVVWRGGSGPTLLLLHGAGDQAGTWFRVVPQLVKGHTLVIPDLAGHGDSAPRTGPIEVSAVLAGAEAVLAREQGPVTIAGNSLGGWIAMLLARRHPDRVARVVAVNGGAIHGQEERVNLLPASREEAARLMGLLRDPASPPVPGFVLDDVVRQAQHGPLARFAATAASMDAWVLEPVALAELHVPVVLLWGASDQVMPLDYARRMLAALPSARLVEIPRCGHVPQQECPGPFLAALLKAVDSQQSTVDSKGGNQ